MNIVVLCGGTSTEREISVVSGTGVCGALRESGHRAILIDVFGGIESVDFMNAFPEEYSVESAAAYIRSMDRKVKEAAELPHRSFFGPNVRKLCRMSDIVFLALHGSNGEDGKVQAAFDLEKIRYTGTGYISSALAMDKNLTKLVFAAQGIPVPRGGVVHRSEGFVELSHLGLDFPVVVKVACGGSSVGVYVVRDEDEYEAALKDCFALEEEVIVEEYIKGREFSVGVIGGRAMPVIEIAPKSGFYDYKTKYTAGAAVETCPAQLSAECSEKMQRLAEKAFAALFMDAYARFDFILKENGEMYCLEANSLPGMTPTSLVPQEAAAMGMSYPELCAKLIEVSLKKY